MYSRDKCSAEECSIYLRYSVEFTDSTVGKQDFYSINISNLIDAVVENKVP